MNGLAMAKKKSRKKKTEAFVLDGSVAFAWCFSDEANPYADAVARKLPHMGAVVPSIWHLEVANAMLVGERRGRCDQADTSSWTAFLASLAIVVDEHSGPRIFSAVLALARAHNLSAYDGAYLELALRRGLPLASLDKPLNAAAVAVGVDLFKT
jgi:predicted nucleic acid-binding protein